MTATDPAGISVNTSATEIDGFAITDIRTAKYVISVSRASEYQATEAMLIHNGTTAQLVTYASILTGNTLMTFSANISNSRAVIYGTGTAAGNTVKLQKTYVKV